MPVLAPPTITSAPTSPDRADRATFSARAIALDDFTKNTQIPELRLALANVAANATDAATSAATAATQAVLATTQATAAAGSAALAGATIWVSGTTYAIGDARYSPINLVTYRRRTAGAGTTDPSLDATNWAAAAASLGSNTYTGAQNDARATVASAATTADIWGAAGNQINYTGNVTTTGFPAAPQAGAERVLICAAAAPFTAGANMLIDGVLSGVTMTCAANDKVIVRAISTTQFMLTRQKADGTAQVSVGGITLGTPVNSTSGTSIDFTGIPAGTKEIALMFSDVSTNGTSILSVLLGDSGGFETTGYSSRAVTLIAATAIASGTSGTRFVLEADSATGYNRQGLFIFKLASSSANTWAMSGSMFETGSGSICAASGRKSLSDTLTQIRITTTAGTDTFDGGVINISYS